MVNWIARLLGWRSAFPGVEPLSETLRANTELPCDQDVQQDIRRGVDLFNAAQYELAMRCFETALERRHDSADAHYYLGLVLHRQGHFEEACDAYVMALCFAPSMGLAYWALALAEWKLGKNIDAIGSVEKAIEAGERNAECYGLRGRLLVEVGNISDALASYEQALNLSLDDASVHATMGYLLFTDCGEYERGAWHLERALQIDPENVTAQCNYAMLLIHRGELDATVGICDRLLSVQPDLHEARLNRALALLGLGRLGSAWDDYESRKIVRGNYIPPALGLAEWQGTDLTEKTILIHGEQGLGDEIMFASCFREIVTRAKRCLIECSPKLHTLFVRSFPTAEVISDWKSTIQERSDLSREIDFQVAAGSLPRFLRRAWSDFPQHHGYLQPDPRSRAMWQDRLDALGPGLKIGLSWRGGAVSTGRTLRSIPLTQLKPLLHLESCHFVDLQYGDTGQERTEVQHATGGRLHHWKEAIDDLDQCAALISSLDLTISVCTAVVHLSGAIGSPVWIMVPRNPDWPFLAAGECMAWYSSAAMIRQRTVGDWYPEIEEVTQRLQAFITSRDIVERA
jgi:tetratricopeptide (TPR) repeat protein